MKETSRENIQLHNLEQTLPIRFHQINKYMETYIRMIVFVGFKLTDLKINYFHLLFS